MVLTGFMGSGKTTVGRLVAHSLGWPFFDCDAVLEEKHAMTIAAIFASYGEPCFRALEEQVVSEVLERAPAVVALGGGALESGVTRARLAGTPRMHLVFLDAPLGVALGRCGAQAGHPLRPLLAEKERLEERYRARLPFYQSAHQTIDTASMSPAEAALEITFAIEQDGTDTHLGQRSGSR